MDMMPKGGRFFVCLNFAQKRVNHGQNSKKKKLSKTVKPVNNSQQRSTSVNTVKNCQKLVKNSQKRSKTYKKEQKRSKTIKKNKGQQWSIRSNTVQNV